MNRQPERSRASGRRRCSPGSQTSVSLWGLLIPIRRGFQQYVNLRPIRVFRRRAQSAAAGKRGRARWTSSSYGRTSRGEYGEIGGRLYRGLPEETAVQEAVFTRKGVTRIVDYAFELAAGRSGRLTSATKSNGIVHTMPFWDELVAERAALHPG
ncbi:isocitrate/isopropylmalate family dehydrogenase [Streptomyces sp. L7]